MALGLDLSTISFYHDNACVGLANSSGSYSSTYDDFVNSKTLFV